MDRYSLVRRVAPVEVYYTYFRQCTTGIYRHDTTDPETVSGTTGPLVRYVECLRS